MDEKTLIVIGVVVVAIIVVFVFGRQLGWIKLSLFGNTGISAGAKKTGSQASANKAEAGRDLRVKTCKNGTATADESKAGRDIEVTSGKE